MKKAIKLFLAGMLDVSLAAALVGGEYYYVYKRPHKLASLNTNVLSAQTESVGQSDGKAQVDTDWSQKFKAFFTDKTVYTDTTYTSKDIAVNIQKSTYGQGKDTVTYFVADIHIASLSCLRTKFAQDTYGVGYSESMMSLSDRVNAVLALNGDSYNNDMHQSSGTIVRNGVLYRQGTSPFDVCVLYSDGTMSTYGQNKFQLNEASKKGVYQTWVFGPALLDENGKAKSKKQFNTWNYIRESHPRSAIGYYEPGHYCMVLVDGRQEDINYSRGMYLEELSQLFESLGCKCAYNLDGGHCSFLTFQGSMVNHPYKPGREISDAIVLTEPGGVS